MRLDWKLGGFCKYLVDRRNTQEKSRVHWQKSSTVIKFDGP